MNREVTEYLGLNSQYAIGVNKKVADTPNYERAMYVNRE